LRKRNFILMSIGLFIVVYVAISLWIVSDVKKAIHLALTTKDGFTMSKSAYMTEDVYNKLNVYQRGAFEAEAPAAGYQYTVDSTFATHIFLIGKARFLLYPPVSW